jgi:hypothetical protein
MTREPVATLATAALGGLLLLVVEPAVGLVALTGTGAALLLQPRPRRLVAAVLALVGTAATVVGIATGAWPLAVGAALVGGAGAVAAVRSVRWPAARRGDRDRARPQPGPPAGPAGDRSDRHTSADTWAALDRGEDPTA